MELNSSTIRTENIDKKKSRKKSNTAKASRKKKLGGYMNFE